jgi:hypothetical protein
MSPIPGPVNCEHPCGAESGGQDEEVMNTKSEMLSYSLVTEASTKRCVALALSISRSCNSSRINRTKLHKTVVRSHTCIQVSGQGKPSNQACFLTKGISRNPRLIDVNVGCTNGILH